jgi:hypothetical protein
MRGMPSLKQEDRIPTIIREQTSESDISEDVNEFEPRRVQNHTYIDQLDKNPLKSMRIEVNLASERRENDFYIYDKKIMGGLKITEHSLIFSRKKLTKEEIRVEAMPLKLPTKLIYFEFECKF